MGRGAGFGVVLGQGGESCQFFLRTPIVRRATSGKEREGCLVGGNLGCQLMCAVLDSLCGPSADDLDRVQDIIPDCIDLLHVAQYR